MKQINNTFQSSKLSTFFKNLFSLAAAILVVTAINAQCGNLYIAGAYDGPLSGGTPKGVQLCANGAIADLSIYGLGSANNGGGTDGEEFTFPADALTAGDCIWVAQEAINFNAFFGFNPNYTSNAMGINGDDAVELFCSGIVEDLFGDINVDGNNTPWEYLDGWAFAADAVANPIFDVAEWTFSGPNEFDGETTNATAATPYPCPQITVCAPFDCPMLSANIGDTCDDNDNTTTNDLIDSNCNCVGTPTGVTSCVQFTCNDVTAVDVTINSDGDVWTCDTTNNSFAMNAFCGGGCAEATENWLIIGDIDLTTAISDLELSLNATEVFGTTDLIISYTSSYNGCPDEVANNWTVLDTITSSETGLLIPLANAMGSNIVIGIQYLDDGIDGYSGWSLSNIELLSSSTCPTVTPNALTCTSLPCNISNAFVSNEACNGNDFEFEINYSIINAADPSGGVLILDATSGYVIGSGTSSPILITLPNNFTTSLLNIVILDAYDTSCASDTIEVTAFNCTLPTCANPGDLIITEFMNNPDTISDNNGEYVEIYNNTNAPIDMFGFLLKDADNDCHTITANLIVPANGYVVLGNDADLTTNGGVTVDYEYSAYFLSNSADEIIIACLGTVIDSVYYNGSFPGSAGVSAELCADSLDASLNDNASAWTDATATLASGDLGSAGIANASCGTSNCPISFNISGVVATGIYQADDFITSNGQVIAASNGDVTYQAGAKNDGTEYIELTIGFVADTLFNFTAINIDCDPTDN